MAARGLAEDASANLALDFATSTEGLQLNRAFVKISDAKVRRKVIELVKALGADEATEPPAGTRRRGLAI